MSVACEKPSVCSDECRLTFSISDTGIGIPSEKLEAIFEDFTQADSSTTRTFGGTGLGLTISKKLVEIMGGKIWVESKVGEGSTFHFNVSMKVGVEKDGAARKKEKLEGKAKAVPIRDSAKTLNMLVVDDSKDIRLLVKTLLKKSPYNIDMAKDGKIAVQMFSSGKYDIVLMDMQMPVMDGCTATAEIRKWEKENGRDETPIIAFTAHALKEGIGKCLEAGCTGHIAKPVKKKALLAVVSKFLGSEENG
jgi:CheY-like chemotaxis protein